MYQNWLSLNTTSYSKAVSQFGIDPSLAADKRRDQQTNNGNSLRCHQATTETNKRITRHEAKAIRLFERNERKRVRWCEWFRNVVFHKNEEFRSLRFLKKCKNCKKSNDAKISIVRKFAAKKKQPWKRNLRRFSHQFFLLLSHRSDATLPALSRNTETFLSFEKEKQLKRSFFGWGENYCVENFFCLSETDSFIFIR